MVVLVTPHSELVFTLTFSGVIWCTMWIRLAWQEEFGFVVAYLSVALPKCQSTFFQNLVHKSLLHGH